jgi:hypothetical protein
VPFVNRVTDEKGLRLPSKIPFFYFPISTELARLIAHAVLVAGVTFRLHHCKGRRHTDEKLFGPPQVKCPSSLADFNQTCIVCSACAVNATCDVSVTPLQW